MKITPECVEKILSATKIADVIGDFTSLKKYGTSGLIGRCPVCGADGKSKGKLKGITVTPAKGIFKCFSCDFGGKSPVDFLMESQKMSYIDALLYLAGKFNLMVEYEKPVRGPQRKAGNAPESYRDRQLAASGLTDQDQKAEVFVDENTRKIADIFESGTRDQYGQITTGDDMIIWYYDLEGKQVMFQKPKTSRMVPLFRIRYQNPALHTDRSGRPMKYESPYGSGSHLYIPDTVRKAYRDARAIKRLYIQEGEKKAEKACKHGLFSVGVMGIHNIGHDDKLPYEFELLIRKCKIEEVIFILDSDWDHLSYDLQPGARVDYRPWSFYRAVKNFRDYFKTFINIGIHLEIYFGHIVANSVQEKGIDDLLAGSLQGKEADLLADINSAINEKDGKGTFIETFRISTMPEFKLQELWALHSPDAFALKYQETLIALPEFSIGRHRWKFGDKGKLEPAEPLLEDEKYWEKTVKHDKQGNPYTTYHFSLFNLGTFLRRRGFGRIMMADGNFRFARIHGRVIELVDHYAIRDYVMEFSKVITESSERKPVMDMLLRGGKMYFGPDSLSNMDYINPVFELAGKGSQCLFFKDKYWKITADSIEEFPLRDLPNYVWQDKIIQFDAKLLPVPMIEAELIDDGFIKKNKLNRDEFLSVIGQYDLAQSPDAAKCHFLQFILHTGEFYWDKFQDPGSRKPIEDTRDLVEKFETNLHFLSKMTAIGYLLHKYRDKSCEKAVIGMDGKLSEVGESNGRSGKSLLGMAIEKVIPLAYIGAKSKDLESDPFLFEEVTEKTAVIFLDDVRANIDFEYFFPMITGRLMVNAKGQRKFTLSDQNTPKLYLTTNHAINGSSSSFKDRQALIGFSDYYNEDFKPVDEFGINFFDEWGEDQWNLFYNFMAQCLQLYFMAQKKEWGSNHSGLIPPPLERFERRRTRQFVGEDLLAWADEYFSIDDQVNVATLVSSNLNIDISRQELYHDFLDKNPGQRRYINPHRFKKKIKQYCEYRGLQFNPAHQDKHGHPGGDHKSGGVEFFTLANELYGR